MNLTEIKGNERAKAALTQYVRNDKVPHAFLFYGMPGIGKFSTALAFSAYLNCANNDPGCSTCISCVKTYKGIHPDIMTVSLSPGKSEISIDQIRDLILKLRYAPIEGKYKIAILDQAELLNDHSANALLKTLEEPPKDSVLILVTSNARVIKPTIVSRCSLIRFSPLTKEVIAERLSGSVEDGRELDLITSISQGSLGKAVSVAGGRFFEIRNGILDRISRADKDPIEISEHLMENYPDCLDEVFDMLLMLYRDMILLSRGIGANLCNKDISDSISKIASSATTRRLLDCARLIYLTRNHIFHNNANPKIALDNLMVNIINGND